MRERTNNKRMCCGKTDFYSQIPKKLIKQLYDDIYKPDFEMFRYEYPQQYIDMGYDGDVER